MRLLDALPWNLLIIAALFLGLAPFMPEPHIWEKLKMLFSGTLTRPVDIGDLVMHGAPWLLLLLKAIREATRSQSSE
jgi:hypothetical protein